MVCCLEAPLVENVPLADGHFRLRVSAPEIGAQVRPGQFVMASPSCPRGTPHPLLKRALAVYSVEGESLLFLVKAVGEGTRRLARLGAGDGVSLVGPLGRGFDTSTSGGRVHLLVAGGIGIASFFLLARQLRDAGEEVHLLYGAGTAGGLVGLDDFEALGIPVSLTTEDGSRGERGRVTVALEQCLACFPARRLACFTCGPDPMMRSVSQRVLERGVPCQISVETKMACGFGVCLGCTVRTSAGYRLSCQDGPVFDARHFLWEESCA